MVYVYHVCDHCHVIRTVYSTCTCIWCTDTLHLYIIIIVSLERGCDDVAVKIKSRSSPHMTPPNVNSSTNHPCSYCMSYY